MRAAIRGLFDGNAPWTSDQLRDAGRENDTNVNFKRARALLRAHRAVYDDMVFGNPRGFAYAEVDAPLSKASGYARIIAEEFNRLLSDWRDYRIIQRRQFREMLMMGLGPMYFNHPRSWRFTDVSVPGFNFEEQTPLEQSRWTMFFISEIEDVVQLYNRTRSAARRTISEKDGWQPEAIDQVLINFYKIQSKATDGWLPQQWLEYIQQQLRLNSSWGLEDRSPFIRLTRVFYMGFNGGVTERLMAEPAGIDSAWLYKLDDKKRRFDQIIVPFYLDPCEDYVRELKGVGHDVYAALTLENRTLCRAVDATSDLLSMIIESKGMPDDERPVIIGRTIQIPNDGRINTQGFNARMEPATVLSNMLRGVLADTSSGLLNGAYLNAVTQPRSAEEIDLIRESQQPERRMSANVFDEARSQLYQEMFRRIVSKKMLSGDPGAEEADHFMEQCIARGVPAQLLKPELVRICAYSTLGYGSPAYREKILSKIGEFSGAFDATGREIFARDAVGQLGGEHLVERYMGQMDVDRVPQDDLTMVTLENTLLSMGKGLPVLPAQPHDTHSLSHLREMQTLLAQRGKVDPMQLDTAFKTFAQHAAGHLDAMVQNPVMKSFVKPLLKQYQDILRAGSVLQADVAKAQKMLKKQQQLQQAQLDQEVQSRIRAGIAEAQVEGAVDVAKARIRVGANASVKREKIQLDHQLQREALEDRRALERASATESP